MVFFLVGSISAFGFGSFRLHSGQKLLPGFLERESPSPALGFCPEAGWRTEASLPTDGLAAEDKASPASGGKLTLNWKVPTGASNIKYNTISVAYAHRNYVSSKDKDTFTDLNTPVSLAASARSYSVTPKELTGQHRFIITATVGSTGEISRSQLDAGFYDDQYIELYRDIVGVDDACGSRCDVAKSKESSLGSDDMWAHTKIAYNNDKPSFQASCTLDQKNKGEARISGCTESEVNMLYTDAVTDWAKGHKAKLVYQGRQKTVNDLLRVNCYETPDDQKFIGQYDFQIAGITAVCAAKDNLKKEIVKAGWTYLGSGSGSGGE